MLNIRPPKQSYNALWQHLDPASRATSKWLISDSFPYQHQKLSSNTAFATTWFADVFQLILQQCCKTSSTPLLPVLPYLKAKFTQINIYDFSVFSHDSEEIKTYPVHFSIFSDKRLRAIGDEADFEIERFQAVLISCASRVCHHLEDWGLIHRNPDILNPHISYLESVKRSLKDTISESRFIGFLYKERRFV